MKTSIDFTHVLSVPTALAVFMTVLTYFFIAPVLSPIVLPGHYPFWTKYKKDYWNSLPMSTIHAFIVTLFALWAILFDQDGTIENQVFMKTRIGTVGLQLCSGFFIGDFIVILSSKQLRKDYRFFIHHSVSLMGVWLGLIFSGHWQLLILFRMLSELSTPFVNMRWLLEEMKVSKQSKWYLICGGCMAITFFLSRIVVIPFLWYFLVKFIVYESSPEAKYHMLPLVKVWVVISYCTLDLLNIYWAKKIAKGFKKYVLQHGNTS